MGICRSTQRACERPGPRNGLQLWDLDCLHTACTGTCWTCTTNVDHLINVLQMENLKDHGNPHLRHDRVVDDNVQFDTVRTCLCNRTAISTLSKNCKGTIHCSAKTAVPSIYIPPWAGGGSHPVSCTCMSHVRPAVWHQARPHAPQPRATTTCSITGTATNCSAVCSSGREERDEAVC